jgi:hypothetical protein
MKDNHIYSICTYGLQTRHLVSLVFSLHRCQVPTTCMRKISSNGEKKAKGAGVDDIRYATTLYDPYL